MVKYILCKLFNIHKYNHSGNEYINGVYMRRYKCYYCGKKDYKLD